MPVTYTTAALVKKRVKYISASLLDADIEENINQVEGIIDGYMKLTARGVSPDFTFDSTKHGIIRTCATAYAAFLCITYDLLEFSTLEVAEMDAHMLWNLIRVSISQLSDPRTVSYFKDL